MSVHRILSDVQLLISGVPQGSVLGPLVLLGSLHINNGIKYYLYADDAQLYVSLDHHHELNFSSSLKNLEHCIAGIRLWMTEILPILNDIKINIT